MVSGFHVHILMDESQESGGAKLAGGERTNVDENRLLHPDFEYINGVGSASD